MSLPRTYREAGVDVEEADRAVAGIARAASATLTPAVLGGVGGFGALYRFDPSTHPDPILVSSTDGVGTKLKVAVALGLSSLLTILFFGRELVEPLQPFVGDLDLICHGSNMLSSAYQINGRKGP